MQYIFIAFKQFYLKKVSLFDLNLLPQTSQSSNYLLGVRLIEVSVLTSSDRTLSEQFLKTFYVLRACTSHLLG